MMQKFNAGIIGTGSNLPEKVMTNFDLEKIVDTSDEWIRTRTGISERRIADEFTATSDIASVAAKSALENAGLTADQIDLILVATVTPDMAFPSTACFVQKNIGAMNATAFDLGAGCSGFIYGLSVANSFISSGIYKNVLVIGAETLSKVINWEDRNTCVLFGDGAGAAVVSRVEENSGILSIQLGANGNHAGLITEPAGGSRTPVTHEVLDKKLNTIHMEGSEVFKLAIRTMGAVSEDVIKESGLTVNDLSLVIPHQANQRIIDGIFKRLNVPKEKSHLNLEKYGNTSAASIPIALDEASRQGKLKKGDNLLMVAFGSGLTWGAAIIKWVK
ncbi:MAG TPA: beta-ketoacyl-ACP synthase III [bacterium]|nr:beta-ketoacyl-ACP synthase III [bacterium]